VPIFWIGIYPTPFLRRLDASVLELLRTMERREAATSDLERAHEPPGWLGTLAAAAEGR
jgi:hypothetical protein